MVWCNYSLRESLSSNKVEASSIATTSATRRGQHKKARRHCSSCLVVVTPNLGTSNSSSRDVCKPCRANECAAHAEPRAMSSHRLPTVQASARYKSAHVLKHAVQSKVHGPRKVPYLESQRGRGAHDAWRACARVRLALLTWPSPMRGTGRDGRTTSCCGHRGPCP